MKPVKISDSEWEVMNLIWAKSSLPASDVVDELSARNGWHSRTIRTLLDRLVKKRALKIKFDGKRNVYEPLLKMEACIRQESKSFLQRVFGGEPGSMLAHLVKESDLSQEDIRKLREILAEKEK